jgi:hypothetical protein
MKSVLMIIIFCFFADGLDAQKITYSSLAKKETGNMFFDILGKFGKDCLIYKNISKEHFLARYDQQMLLVEQLQLGFIPDKAFNLDFITYSDFLVGVYQYQKNNIIYCYAFRLDSSLSTNIEPIVIDTARIGFYADNKIYNLTFSENKKRILVYKRTLKAEQFTQTTKTFNPELLVLDSSSYHQQVNNRRDYMGEPTIDNDGNILFCHMHERSQKFGSDSLSLIYKRAHEYQFESQKIELDRYFIRTPVLKVDQINKKYIINAYASTTSTGEADGLFTTQIDFSWQPIGSKFNAFTEELKRSMNTSGYNNTELPDILPRNILLKKNNGFMLIAESGYTETARNPNLPMTWGGFGGSPYGFANDYYFYDPYSFRYRPWGSNSAYQQVRFHYDNIIMLNIDSSLHMVTKSMINKKQSDVETDNFLSFGLFTRLNELHFLFLERDRRRDVLSDHALQTDGQLKRYPTISSQETNYEFMPKLGKQISARQFIIPFAYLNRIGFAKIEWP